MIKTLQKKFILSAMLAITILLVILLGAINAGNIYFSERQSRQTVQMLLNAETMLHPPKGRKPRGFWEAPMDENSKMAAIYFTVRTDPNSDALKADTGRIAGISEEEALELYREAMAQGLPEGKIRNFRYKAAVSERDTGSVYLFLDTSPQLRGQLLVLLFSIIAGLACWLAMLLLVVLISKKAIRPIAENISRQKQFVTDAGHEIKTPLAIILANTEAMELYQGESKWSKNIREQTVRLNGLMQNLLALAKADEGRERGLMQAVSVSSVVSESLQMFAEPMALKGLGLYKRLEEDIQIKANREQLQQLVSILLDNAVKYSVPGGAVTVLLERHSRTAVLQIENACAALPECPPEKLFDRFYRADTARTQVNGGYGIGLSAAKTIAELYGGIKASYHQPDRIAFTVTFSL